MKALAAKYGTTVNSKGYQVLNHVRVIQGDGINEDTIRQILQNLLIDGFSAENVAFGLRVRPRATRPSDREIRAKVADLLKLVQLDWIADRYPHQLSGGQRQRIALARAIIRRPRLLVLDDATSAVDPSVERAILTRLRDGRAGMTVLVVAYRMATIALADRVAYLEDGRIVATGSHAELMASVPGYARVVGAYAADHAERQAAGDATTQGRDA